MRPLYCVNGLPAQEREDLRRLYVDTAALDLAAGKGLARAVVVSEFSVAIS